MEHNAPSHMADMADVVNSIEAEEKVIVPPTFNTFRRLAFRPSKTPSESRYSAPRGPRRPVPAPVEKSVPNVVPRARDSKGQPFPTACFDWKYAPHAHHHRLTCGHDVVTEEIEPCGSSCAMKDGSKVTNRPFICPATKCKAKVKALFPKRNTITGQFTKASGRPCTLSHVYGLDRDNDAERIAEKQSEAGRRQGPKAVRKRSESPEAGGWGGAKKEVVPRKRRQSGVATTAAEVNKLIQESGVVDLMKRLPATTKRRLHGDRLETVEDAFKAIAQRAAAKAHAPDNSLPFFRETRNVRTENVAADTVQDGDYPEQHEDADLFCVCRTTSGEWLVICERCSKGFHPGCIGEGERATAEYVEDMPNREALLKHDFDNIMEHGHSSAFHCPDCQEALAAALAKFEDGAWERRAAVVAEDEEVDDDVLETMFPTADDQIIIEMQTAAGTRGKKRKAEDMESESEAESDGEDVNMEDATPESQEDHFPDRPRMPMRHRANARGSMPVESDIRSSNARRDSAREDSEPTATPVRRSTRKSARPRYA